MAIQHECYLHTTQKIWRENAFFKILCGLNGNISCSCGGFDKSRCKVEGCNSLTTKSVQSTALALQSVDNIHGGDGLSLGMLSVGDSISDDIL